MNYVSWNARRRPSQIPPSGDWLVWLIQAGRGYGKTATGGGTVIERVRSGQSRYVALVAPTAADVRDIMINEEKQNDPTASGILPMSPPDFRPKYIPSKRRLEWPNGAIALGFSAEDPDQIRGPEFDFAWLDEFAAWPKSKREETFSNLEFALRLGEAKMIITTTPKPFVLLKQIRARASTVITRGHTQENMTNLSPAYIERIIKPYMGTQKGRQELEGELLEENEAALWDIVTVDANRVSEAPENMDTVAIAVDPSGSKAGHGIGIVGGARVGGRGGLAYVLGDYSLEHATPNEWAKRVIRAYDELEADYVIVERNYGGDMVANTIMLVAQIEGHPAIPIKEVNATRGKAVRAEPISSLTQQSRVKFVGSFINLEDQLYDFESGESDDIADAFVWLVTDFLGSGRRKPIPEVIAGNAKDYKAPVRGTELGNIWERAF